MRPEERRLAKLYEHVMALVARESELGDAGLSAAQWATQGDLLKALTEAQRLEERGKERGWLGLRIREYGEARAELESQLRRLPDADRACAEAIQLDKRKDADAALDKYHEAGDLYVAALKQQGLAECQRQCWTARAEKVMNRLEELQRERVKKGHITDRDAYSREELDVLRESSYVNGRLFVPWAAGSDGQRMTGFANKFVDPDGKLRLSASQRARFHAWRRPTGPMVTCVDAASVQQELVEDCSFVSSLCIAAHHEHCFGGRLVTGIIFPQDESGQPVANPSGMYAVRLWYNGAARKVIVDDRLPVDEEGRWLCSFAPGQQWVSIIEKAYMKINGGYDFPGSVSGIDLYALTGWIPEVHALEALGEDPVEREATWARLLSAAGHGDVLMTAATGRLGERASALGLVPTHAYAVLGAYEVRGLRLLQLKNPWSSTAWRGAFSADDERWDEELQAALQYNPRAARKRNNGVFWLDYESLLDCFHAVYMSWNPEHFATRLVVHRRWAHSGPRDDSFNVGANPQFELTLDVPEPSAAAAAAAVASSHDDSGDRGQEDGREGQEGVDGDRGGDDGESERLARRGRESEPVPSADGIVWLLLSRHVLRKEQLLSNDKGDFMTLNVYENGRRVYYPEKPLVRGVYSNNPNCLISFQAKPGRHRYTVVVSLFERTRAQNYTLTVYASHHCKRPALRELPLTLAHTREVRGEWTAGGSAGGCPRYASFMHNPQWRLRSERPIGRLHVRLLAPRELAVNVRLFDTGGRRVFTADPRRQAASSGAYRKGMAVLETAEGELNGRGGGDGEVEGSEDKLCALTLVASAFTPKPGPFILAVESDTPIALEPVPPEGHDFACVQEQLGAWEGPTAAGSPNGGTYHRNPGVLLVAPAATRLLARLEWRGEQAGAVDTAPPAQWPSLNLALFRGTSVSPREDLTHAMESSNGGVYSNPPCGVTVGPLDLEPGEYLLMPSTFTPVAGAFRLRVFSSVPVAVEEAGLLEEELDGGAPLPPLELRPPPGAPTPTQLPAYVVLARRLLDELGLPPVPSPASTATTTEL